MSNQKSEIKIKHLIKFNKNLQNLENENQFSSNLPANSVPGDDDIDWKMTACTNGHSRHAAGHEFVDLKFIGVAKSFIISQIPTAAARRASRVWDHVVVDVGRWHS